MIVICEECGKKYRVDPSRIKGKAASFSCHACRHVIVVFKPKPISSQGQPMPNRDALPKTAVDDRAGTIDVEKAGGVPDADPVIAAARQRHRPGGLGLRAKMLLLFLLIPLILTAGAFLFYIWQFGITPRSFSQEGAAIFARLADKEIMVALAVFGAALLLFAIIVVVYAQRLAGKIKTLTEIAERISGGELEVEVETKSRDEIGQLAAAIAGMRDYIRLSVDRLQRR